LVWGVRGMKKALSILMVLFASLMIFSIFAVAVSATVTTGVTSNVIPDGYGFIDFETGTEGEVIYSTIPGLSFTTTGGYDWIYVDVRTGGYNLRSLTDPSENYGEYVCNGYFIAWLGADQPSGRIDFTMGTASYFSVLVTCNTDFTVDAYDGDDNLIATSGVAASNFGTYTFSRCTVEAPGMAYVICHNSGNYWGIDDLVTDAPGVPQFVIPEIPFGTIGASTSMIVGLLVFIAIPRVLHSRKASAT
jgi:hypothetical protein